MKSVTGQKMTMLPEDIDLTNVPKTLKSFDRSLVGQLFMPLSFRDIRESLQEHGYSGGAALSIMALLGTGVATYGPKSRYMDAKPEERKNFEWDDQPVAYREFLTNEQLEMFEDARKYHVGRLILAATDVEPKQDTKQTDEDFAEEHRKWEEARDKALERLAAFPKEQVMEAFKLYWVKRRSFKWGSSAARKRRSEMRKMNLVPPK